MKSHFIEEISPWHIQEENITRLQRDLLSRESETRALSPPPTSPDSVLRLCTLRKRIMSDIKQAYTAPLIRPPDQNSKQKLVPRVYKLFEEHAESQPIKRFSSQKDILASPRPTNKITIKISLGKSRELRHSYNEIRVKARPAKTFYHGSPQKFQLKSKQTHKKRDPFALEIYSLKDKIESIFKHRGQRLPPSQAEDSVFAKLSKQARLKSVMQSSTLAYQHVNNIRPVFSRKDQLKEIKNRDDKKYRPVTNHYLDKLIGRLE